MQKLSLLFSSIVALPVNHATWYIKPFLFYYLLPAKKSPLCLNYGRHGSAKEKWFIAPIY